MVKLNLIRMNLQKRMEDWELEDINLLLIFRILERLRKKKKKMNLHLKNLLKIQTGAKLLK